MIIRIESSVTMQIAERHYLKETRSLEMEHEDILGLLTTDPELQGRYEEIAAGDRFEYEAVQDAFYTGFAALRDGLWDALDDQINELLPTSDDDDEE